MTNDKDLLETINDFTRTAASISTGLEELKRSVEILSNTFSDLDKINKLNESINNASDSTKKLLSISSSLDSSSEKISSFDERINKINEAIDGVFAKLTSFEKSSDIFNEKIEKIESRFSSINEKMSANQKKIEEIQENYSSLLRQQNQLSELLITKEGEIAEASKALTKIIKELNEKSMDEKRAEQFLNDYITAWYKENVTFFGLKKKI